MFVATPYLLPRDRRVLYFFFGFLFCYFVSIVYATPQTRTGRPLKTSLTFLTKLLRLQHSDLLVTKSGVAYNRNVTADSCLNKLAIPPRLPEQEGPNA